MKKILNYIDGNLKEALSKKIIENESPVDGKLFSHIADSDKEDVELAVQAAKKAFQMLETNVERRLKRFYLFGKGFLYCSGVLIVSMGSVLKKKVSRSQLTPSRFLICCCKMFGMRLVVCAEYRYVMFCYVSCYVIERALPSRIFDLLPGSIPS